MIVETFFAKGEPFFANKLLTTWKTKNTALLAIKQKALIASTFTKSVDITKRPVKNAARLAQKNATTLWTKNKKQRS